MIKNMADGSENVRDQDDEDQTASNTDTDLTGLSGGNGGIDLTNMVQACADEYQNLEGTLEEIDSWMNKIEKQNDSLSSELDALLQSSREVRQDLKQQSDLDPAKSTENQPENDTAESS